MQSDIESGDLGIVIAGHKFYELSNLIHSANYSIKQSYKIESTNIKSYFLRYAILDYNACYDYFDQIIYFAFDFFPDFSTSKEYLNILRKCRRSLKKNTNFDKDIESLISKNNDAKEFFEKYDNAKEFVNDKDFGIKEWANNIKHQGGFWFKEDLMNYGIIKCINDGQVLFSSRELLAYEICHQDAFKRLLQQNKHIITFANWLIPYIFEKKIPREKRFSANKNHFKETKIDFNFIEDGTE